MDFAQAVHWYRLAAEQGQPQAQSNLGFMYQNGQGVARDPGQAVQWWRRAALGGNTSALFNLAVAYFNGDGVMADDIEAYKWVELAEAHASDERQLKYTALRETLLMKMTTAQVAEGHQRVQEWTGVFNK